MKNKEYKENLDRVYKVLSCFDGLRVGPFKKIWIRRWIAIFPSNYCGVTMYVKWLGIPYKIINSYSVIIDNSYNWVCIADNKLDYHEFFCLDIEETKENAMKTVEKIANPIFYGRY